MTAKICSSVTAKVIQRLAATGGPFSGRQVRSENVAAELAERSDALQYPTIYVYCEKAVNSLAEKFRSFSGSVQMAIELRHTSEKLAGLQEELEQAADAATNVLSASRGDWGDGAYYAGAYQVAFGTIKRGGKNFAQTAKVTFEIGASIS